MKINCTEKTIWTHDTFCNRCHTTIEAGEDFMHDPLTNYRECMNCHSCATDEALKFHIELLERGPQK